MLDRARPIIDCDVHPGVPGIGALLPYMDAFWQEQFTSRGIDNMEIASYPPTAPLTCRPDWRDAGLKPGEGLAGLQARVLDGFGAGIAICNPLYGGQVAHSETMGTAICAAMNDWIRAEWLDRDDRLRASIAVAAQAPELAAEEIDRCAADKRFVQVLLLVANELPLGRRYYWPIFEAARRHGLPVGIHAGSMYRYPTTPSGWPTHFLQDIAAVPAHFQTQLQSLLSEGTFSRFDDLVFVLIESGVAWMPPYLWRTTKTWRGVRGEIPWMKRSPSVEVRERVKLTIQPFDMPDDPARVAKLTEQLGSDEMLLFSSDYPHWQFDGDDPMPPGIPPDLADRIMRDNPLKAYPRLKEPVA